MEVHSIETQYGVSLYIPEDVIEKNRTNCFLRNITVTKIGHFMTSQGHCIERDGIKEFIILYCVDGRGWIKTKGKRSDVSKGEMVFCDINTSHSYGADSRKPWTIYWAHFVGDGVAGMFDILKVNESSNVLEVGVNTVLISLMNEAYNTIYKGYSLPNLIHASTCIQKLFSEMIIMKMNSVFTDSSDVNIEKIISFMLNNIDKTITLGELSDYARISKYHFARKFKNRTGYSPMDYFRRLKIQKACELLETSSLNVKEISNMLGFESQFYFSEAFKNITGYSPAVYRKK